MNPNFQSHFLKRFKLDKASGKKSVWLEAWELDIAWGSLPEYLEWIPLPNTRPSEVPEPPEERWFDLKGKIEARWLSPKTTYVAYLTYNTWGRSYECLPAKTFIIFVGKKGDGYETTNNVILEPSKSSQPRKWPNWREIELGEFFTGQGDNGKVKIQLMEIERGKWKGGILVQGIVLRPKSDY